LLKGLVVSLYVIFVVFSAEYVMAQNYAVAIDGNKPFTGEVSVEVGDQITFDIYLQDAPTPALTGGAFVDFSGSTAFVSFVRGGRCLTNGSEGCIGPWKEDMGSFLNEPDGPGTAMYVVGNFGNAVPDGEGDLIVGTMTLQYEAMGTATIDITTIPTFETWSISSSIFDDTINSNTINPVLIVNERDSDGDGVYDDRDRCPDTPAGVPVDSDGCPKDSDGDGIYDYIDECPDTLEGVNVDEKGCAIMVKEKVSIELKVEFEFDSTVIKETHKDDIRKLAEFLKTYPETNAVIEGHTCNIGTEKYNLKLSLGRAESVRQRLAEYGIDSSRLEIIGLGETVPGADNKTEEGRKKNRRVFSVISTTVTKYQKNK